MTFKPDITTGLGSGRPAWVRLTVTLVGTVMMLTVATARAWATPAIATTMVSVDSAGLDANGPSQDADGSMNGRIVVFESQADDLVPNDTNLVQDIFARDLITGVTTRVSVTSLGKEADAPSFDPAVSTDGRWVAFSSDATLDPIDTNGFRDVYLHDRASGQTRLVSLSTGGAVGNGDSNHPRVSPFPLVVFDSQATNFVPADANGPLSDVFVRNVPAGQTRLLSRSTGGVQGNDASTYPDIGPAGNTIAYQSRATNLVAADINNAEDVFVFLPGSGQTRLVSLSNVPMQGNGPSGRPEVDGGGTRVVYHSDASNLVAGDANGHADVFMRDFAAGTTVVLSVLAGNGPATNPSITNNGNWVLYESTATNLVAGDTNAAQDIFASLIGGGFLARVSVNSGGGQANGPSSAPAASENPAGQPIANFDSEASNLDALDLNTVSDVFQFRP
jgi:Tol biopolymer transport system component